MLNYWHWAGVTPYTSVFTLAGSCVFDKQSLRVKAGHLANLRPAFVAEFLKDDSLDRLCILNSPTCVGLWYG